MSTPDSQPPTSNAQLPAGTFQPPILRARFLEENALGVGSWEVGVVNGFIVRTEQAVAAS
jgi:hypothetical protein